MIASGSCTGGGATNLQGLPVPIEPRQPFAPSNARIEAAEARAGKTVTQRMPLDEARRAVVAERRRNTELQTQIKSLQTQLEQAGQQSDPAALIAAQQDNVALQAKVEDLDQQLQGARERITALESRATRAEQDLARARKAKAPQPAKAPYVPPAPRKAPTTKTVPAKTAGAKAARGPVCAGGCGREVKPGFVEQFGQSWHNACAGSVPADVLAATAKARGRAA
jgi:hypothetical protein